MFSIKKYALIGVAALTAFTISCTEEEGSTNTDWVVKQDQKVLGGVSNSDFGSSLDIDADKVYKLSEVTAAIANEIDIIFDGTNIWTPNSIKAGGSDIASLKSKYASSTSTAFIFNVKSSTTTADDLIDAWDDVADDAPDAVISNVSTGKKFGVLTSTGNYLALVTVKEKDPEDGVKILIEILKVAGEE